MRGKLSDQDLTNYALNEGLDARERLYVESMLGLSEECRGDVYKMLDLSTLLEKGFEQEADLTAPCLTAAQRTRLLTATPRFEIFPVVRKTAAALSLAACVAFVLANPQVLPEMGNHTRTISAVSNEMTRYVAEVMNADTENDYAMWVAPATMSNDDSTIIQASSDGMPMPQVETICTPPSWQETGDFSEVH